MATSEEEYKKHLIELANVIREKYKKLKRDESDYHFNVAKKFQAKVKTFNEYTDPNLLIQPVKATTTPSELESKAKEFLAEATDISISPTKCDDKVYGIKKMANQWFMGQTPLKFTKEKVELKGKTYPASPGLIELLTRKLPLNYTTEDLHNYKMMLEATGYHLTTKKDNLKRRTGHKYKNVIRPCFPQYSEVFMDDDDIASDYSDAKVSTSFDEAIAKKEDTMVHTSTPYTKVIGKGLKIKTHSKLSTHSPLMKVSNSSYIGNRKQIDYVYWDDPNELVERLHILHLSKQAGNTNLDNEILNIEEELREGGYIY